MSAMKRHLENKIAKLQEEKRQNKAIIVDAFFNNEISENKKEINTSLTRALMGIVDDVKTLSSETTEEIKEQLELLAIASKVNNDIKTY